MLKKSLFILIIILLIISAYFIYQRQTTSNSSEKASEQSSSLSVSLDNQTNNWNTYVNEKHNFSFKYPENWTEYSDEDSSKIEENIQSPTRKGMQITLYENVKDMTANKYLEEIYYVNEDEGTQKLNEIYFRETEYLPVKVGEVEATQFELRAPTGSRGTAIWINKDSNGILLRFYPVEGQKELIQPIISTFKFLNDDSQEENWKTYTNDKYNYEVKYPENFNIVDVHTNEDVTFGGKEAVETKPTLLSVHVFAPGKFNNEDIQNYAPYDYKIIEKDEYTYFLVASTYMIGVAPSKQQEERGKVLFKQFANTFKFTN